MKTKLAFVLALLCFTCENNVNIEALRHSDFIREARNIQVSQNKTSIRPSNVPEADWNMCIGLKPPEKQSDNEPCKPAAFLAYYQTNDTPRCPNKNHIEDCSVLVDRGNWLACRCPWQSCDNVYDMIFTTMEQTERIKLTFCWAVTMEILDQSYGRKPGHFINGANWEEYVYPYFKLKGYNTTMPEEVKVAIKEQKILMDKWDKETDELLKKDNEEMRKNGRKKN